jgi:hypothetical protein
MKFFKALVGFPSQLFLNTESPSLRLWDPSRMDFAHHKNEILILTLITITQVPRVKKKTEKIT